MSVTYNGIPGLIFFSNAPSFAFCALVRMHPFAKIVRDSKNVWKTPESMGFTVSSGHVISSAHAISIIKSEDLEK